jgi:peptide deformylase
MSQLSIVTASLETASLLSLCLRQKAVDVPSETSPDVIRKLVEEMLACLYMAGGVGLAAPQVGVGWRLFLAMERGSEAAPSVFINPRLTDMSDETVDGREGCLSLPGYISYKVPRSCVVKVEALDQFLEPIQVEASEFMARVIQHEYDHLDGILFLDRLRQPEDLEPYSIETRVRKSMEELYITKEDQPAEL